MLLKINIMKILIINKIALFTVILFFATNSSFSQNYYIPLNDQAAYEAGTRSKDGNPGPDYWQNKADYNLEVELDTKKDIVTGKGTVTYYNNSPDTLKRIVLRLYQNLFKKGNARQFPVSPEVLTDGMKITKFATGNDEYDLSESSRWEITNRSIRLKKVIPPGGSETFEMEWNFQIPVKRALRMGKYDDGHYFIAYWYPQIAVYDDIDGWDMVEYLGMVEFYNDFNDFDVKITVPGDYIVRATGVLQNAGEILSDGVLQRFNNAKKSDTVVRIFDYKKSGKKSPNKKGKNHTWRYVATNVPDVSFLATNQSNWDGTSVVVDSATNRRVLAEAVYPDSLVNWDRGAEITAASVGYMSFKLPGVAYPYPHMTSFCAGSNGGGMETPMMANDGAPKRFESFAGLLFHEISHSYFPFYMGTNERKWAFMDEGWAAYLPEGFLPEYNPESKYMEREVRSYTRVAGQDYELPLMVPTYQHNNYSSSRTASYTRPAVAYSMLRMTLGDDMFKKALKEYMSRWNGKHPVPYDFFHTFENVTGENLNWFFVPWFFDFGYPDLGIMEVTGNRVVISKNGVMPVPVEIHWFADDDSDGKITVNASVWKDGDHVTVVELPEGKIFKKVILGSDLIPDSNRDDNTWKW